MLCCDSNNRPVPVVNPSPSNLKHARRSCECKPRPASNHEMPLRVLTVKRGFNLKGRDTYDLVAKQTTEKEFQGYPFKRIVHKITVAL